ncbi:MAG: hypothetical protein KDB03_01625 [Planctomycetales bacterium]|nr:hypothetical protein [Planctomycetales bacterium]
MNPDGVMKAFEHHVRGDRRFPGAVRIIDGPVWEFGVGYVAAYVGPELPVHEDRPIRQIVLDVTLERSDFGLF